MSHTPLFCALSGEGDIKTGVGVYALEGVALKAAEQAEMETHGGGALWIGKVSESSPLALFLEGLGEKQIYPLNLYCIVVHGKFVLYSCTLEACIVELYMLNLYCIVVHEKLLLYNCTRAICK